MEFMLSDGNVCQIDRADLPLVAGYRWRLHERGNRRFVRAFIAGKLGSVVTMHSLIMRPSPGNVVVALDRDPLNLRRKNLRVVRRGTAEIARNGPKSGYFGVYPHPCGYWQAKVRVGKKVRSFGYRRTPEEAAALYDARVRPLLPDAPLNFPETAETKGDS